MLVHTVKKIERKENLRKQGRIYGNKIKIKGCSLVGRSQLIKQSWVKQQFSFGHDCAFRTQLQNPWLQENLVRIRIHISHIYDVLYNTNTYNNID